jgi:hypothetical protein
MKQKTFHPGYLLSSDFISGFRFQIKGSFKLDSYLIVFSLLFSIVGIGYFSHGRKNHPMFLIAGGLLMIFPYFINSLVWLILVGILLCALPFFIDL